MVGKVIASNHYAGCNVGIVCGRVVAIDIDELDPRLRSSMMKDLATKHLGPTQFERIGRAPRPCCCIDRSMTFRPIKIAGCIDVLANGRQFVAYGIHPDTGQPYRWRRQPLQSSDSKARGIAADHRSRCEGFR